MNAKPITQREASDLVLTDRIVAIHAASDGAFGAPRVHSTLKAQGIDVGHNRVARIMRDQQISGARLRKRAHTALDYPPDLLARDFDVRQLDRVWAGDITQIMTADGWLYLAVLLDLCSRCAVGWACSARPDTRLTLAALETAIMDRRIERNAIHHSDRGAQYSAAEYLSTVKRYGFRVSMSDKGECLDNAVVESFFSTVKRELEARAIKVRDQSLKHESRAHVTREIDRYLGEVYNATRPHSALGYLSPLEFEARKRARSRRARR